MFRSEGGRPEAYVVTVRRFGLDLGITEQSRFTWAVMRRPAGSGAASSPALTAASAPMPSVGVGGGGNFLVGGPSNAYALQPISVQGQTGFNVAAGVADLELEPVQTRPWPPLSSSYPSYALPSRLKNTDIHVHE